MVRFRRFVFENMRNFFIVHFFLLSIVIIGSAKSVNEILTWYGILIFLFLLFFPFFKEIYSYRREIVKRSKQIEELSEDDKKALLILRSLLFYEHSEFSKELVEINLKILGYIKAVTDENQHFRINNIEELYQSLLKKYYLSFKVPILSRLVNWLNKKFNIVIGQVFTIDIKEYFFSVITLFDPVVVLLHEQYSSEIDQIFLENMKALLDKK